MTIRSCQSNNLTLSSLLFQKSKPQSIAGESSTNKEEKPPKPKVSWPALICFSKLIMRVLLFFFNSLVPQTHPMVLSFRVDVWKFAVYGK